MSKVRKEGQRHRAAVLARDRGVCAICGVDTVRLWDWIQTIPLISAIMPTTPMTQRSRMLKTWRYGRIDAHTQKAFRRVLGRHRFRAAVLLGRLWGTVIEHHRKQLWQMDHVVPVVEGGGGCGLENLRTLCLRCHNIETGALAGRLARRPSKGVGR